MRGRRFSPLDDKLRLRADHWSDGAARVATRQGLQAPSFEQAAEAYTEAVGGAMSSSSLRRITLGVGEEIAERKQAEAEWASAPAQRGEDPCRRRVAMEDPIVGQANLSTDGTMIRLREEGWKEVKLSAISQVEVAVGEEPPSGQECDWELGHLPSIRRGEPRVHLTGHSYCAGLWDADELGRHLYAEGLRRGVDRVERLSSVNDGAVWIERITLTNFPKAVQIVDWSHASRRLWAVAQAVYGEGSEKAKAWVEANLDALWAGRGWVVVGALHALLLEQSSLPAEVRQAPGYFESNLARMRYRQFRAEGYPIGSGTVESGGKNVVHHRMRRPGQGWTRDNAQAMLAALSELHSGRFDRVWQQLQLPIQTHPHF